MKTGHDAKEIIPAPKVTADTPLINPAANNAPIKGIMVAESVPE
ncbi:hypothetical protein [Xenorhabdus cabanillasii]|nr:hypothetical protein [Xenorhabdus sp. Flor]